MKILLIDDDVIFHILITEVLKPSGHEIFLSSGPHEGITMFEDIMPDLVLLDVHMPEMSGCEVAPVLKEIAKEYDKFVPIIFFTSSNDDHELVMCLDLGGDDLISKPFNENLLEVKLRAWERNSKLINENKMPHPPGLSSCKNSNVSEEELHDLMMPMNKL
ncbi:MAG: response regulator transcription factor [Magnetococcales bacterium]|nr:response regulator transcription factor [Magnetococcales bacterium]